MISKIYGSNQILFKVGSRKGKTKAQLQVMVERRKDKKYRNKNYKKWVQNLAMRRKKGWL